MLIYKSSLSVKSDSLPNFWLFFRKSTTGRRLAGQGVAVG